MAIFGFFVLFAGRKYRDHLNEYNQVRFEMAKQLTEYQLEKSPFDADDISPSFQAFIEHLDLAFKSKIWLTDSEGNVIIHSFKGSFPDDLIEDLLTNRITEEAIIKHRHYQAYRKGPINLGDGRQGSIHLLFDRHPPFAYGSGFGIGLFLIGLIVALLTFPLARKISKPIKILTESAKRLEQGDLGHRTTASSRDEIGELASAFNRMAEKLGSERPHRGGEPPLPPHPKSCALDAPARPPGHRMGTGCTPAFRSPGQTSSESQGAIHEPV